MRTIAAAALLALAVAPAHAHDPFGFGPGWGYGFQFSGRGFSAYSYYRAAAFNPYGFAPHSGWPGAWAPTIVVTPPPVIVVAPDSSRDLARLVGRLPQVPPPDELDLLRRAPVPKAPKPKLIARPALPAPPPPAANDADEARRQLQLGKDALAEGQPGRAEERFRRAATLAPDNADAHLLLAQALYALGRYREAVVSIHDGLKLKPDWPAAKFDVRGLYGDHAADHALDLERLRRAAERSPEEPALAFLYGYQLWFNGRKKEARPFLERAAAQAADPKPIRLFLDLADGERP